jgi:uncharacterized protein (TIGR03032 family)
MELTSVHTSTFCELLQSLGISLVVSTYQAGKLIILRNDGRTLNTHFRNFTKPMGLAVDRGKLAIGTNFQIWELHNLPALAAKLEPTGKHDACYLPRRSNITGDIDIHEMDYANGKLWFVNTRFSCLCTLEESYSFVPQWRPPFVSGYDISDRCHLNGLGIRDDQPRYITALGATDNSEGWRKNKAAGGILMDIQNNQFICRGLSMPHSPRWYGGRLWVLESGIGSLAKVDLASGKWETVIELPSFTRGLDFWGDWAFIGLSKIRETAMFGDLPISQLAERTCGVWAVNLKTGKIGAFVRFEQGVEEIFAVRVLPHCRFPEVFDWEDQLLASSFVLPDQALKEIDRKNQ